MPLLSEADSRPIEKNLTHLAQFYTVLRFELLFNSEAYKFRARPEFMR